MRKTLLSQKTNINPKWKTSNVFGMMVPKDHSDLGALTVQLWRKSSEDVLVGAVSISIDEVRPNFIS